MQNNVGNSKKERENYSTCYLCTYSRHSCSHILLYREFSSAYRFNFLCFSFVPHSKIVCFCGSIVLSSLPTAVNGQIILKLSCIKRRQGLVCTISVVYIYIYIYIYIFIYIFKYIRVITVISGHAIIHEQLSVKLWQYNSRMITEHLDVLSVASVCSGVFQ